MLQSKKLLSVVTKKIETRTLIKVTLADAKGAMAKASDMFEILMGNDVSKRKLFIEKNAKDVRFLDV